MSSDPDTERQNGGTHGGDGDFIRTVETAERDAEAARLRSRGKSYRHIAAELGMSVSTAHEAVQRALKAIVEEPAQDVRTLELDRLDAMYDKVIEVLERRHVTVSNGKVIYVDDVPLDDDAPILAAVDRLLKIQERRARLLGLDAPAKAEIGGKLSYEIVGVDLEAL